MAVPRYKSDNPRRLAVVDKPFMRNRYFRQTRRIHSRAGRVRLVRDEANSGERRRRKGKTAEFVFSWQKHRIPTQRQNARKCGSGPPASPLAGIR